MTNSKLKDQWSRASFWVNLPCLALVGLAQATGLAGPGVGQSTAPVEPGFKCERYDAQGGALFKSYGGNFTYNNSVNTVFVDSKGRVWVGTVTGLAVYDGKQWKSRTFKVTAESVPERVVIGIFRLKDCGPYTIAEGPPGTIWLGGHFGIWRFRDGRYKEITSRHFGYISGMAVDHEGALWVVTKYNVHRYDGKTWNIVLCPYRAKSISRELPGLRGIAVGTNGAIWIGATMYWEPKGPWSHDGPVWVVDQGPKKQNGGPPNAPLFEFDGKRWRAFGPQHGLGVKAYGDAMPELDELGRIRVRTSEGRYLLEGETWKLMAEPLTQRWVLRERKRGSWPGYAELLYRDGKRLLPVQTTDYRTGESLGLGSDQLVMLCLIEDRDRNCVWLGTWHGLYRIWREVNVNGSVLDIGKLDGVPAVR